MSLDLYVPGGNPNKPGFSVQRNAHGLSISAGALASTNTMFGIANHEGGLSVSAWPVSPVGLVGPAGDNLCPNPRFHYNVTDGWTFPDAPGPLSYEATRVTTPPVALPDGTDACVRVRWRLWGGANPVQTTKLIVPADTATVYAWAMMYTDDAIDILHDIYAPYVTFYDAGDAPLYGAQLEKVIAAGAGFRAGYILQSVPDGAVTMSASFGGFFHDETHFYVTKVLIGSAAYADYGDGDSPGWAWVGEPHNSASGQS